MKTVNCWPSSASNKLYQRYLADFTIQIEKNVEGSQAHTVRLANSFAQSLFILLATILGQSSVFRRITNKLCEEYKQPLLKIKDEGCFRSFLALRVHWHLPDLPLNEASEVLILLDKYDIQELKEMCDDMTFDLLVEIDSNLWNREYLMHSPRLVI